MSREYLEGLKTVLIVYSLDVSEVARFPELFIRKMTKSHVGRRMVVKGMLVQYLTAPLHRACMIPQSCEDLGWPIPYHRVVPHNKPPVS
ncbi:unnamed protein product [Cochlearia groenlandica]